MTSTLRSATFAALAVFAFASAAGAHPQVTSAGPAPGSVVKTSPKAIQIAFNEAVVASFSSVELTNAKGEKQNVGTATPNLPDKKQLIVPVNGELSPGKYTVVWHAVGDDTHKVDGKFDFELKP